MNEKVTFSEVNKNMQAILEKPALYSAKITCFTAGGLGACAYSDDISVGELVRCWQHEEYQTTCPDCGEKAYITYWAGNVNGGGYWEIVLYCPKCDEEKHSHLNRFCCRTHWLKMREILREEREAIKRTDRLESPFEEMARIGFLGEQNDFEVYVRTDDLEHIPHIHIRDTTTKGKVFETCVRLQANEYCHHARYTDVMDSKLVDDFYEFMCANPQNPYFNSYYESAIAMLNMNNEWVKMEPHLDADGKVIVPDYRKLKSTSDNFAQTTEL